jgi:hypothetical protein
MEIAADKKKHVWVGILIGIAVIALMLWYYPKYHNTWATDFWYIPKFQYVLGAVFWGAVIGLLKEFVWDLILSKKQGIKNLWLKLSGTELKDGTFDLKDAWWTIAGSFIGAFPVWILALIFGWGNTNPPFIPNQTDAINYSYAIAYYNHLEDSVKAPKYALDSVRADLLLRITKTSDPKLKAELRQKLDDAVSRSVSAEATMDSNLVIIDSLRRADKILNRGK